MARQLLTATAASRAGVTVSDASVIAADGAQVVHTTEPRLLFRLTNSGGSSAVVTFRIATTVDSQLVVNNGRQVTVAASATKFVGPFTGDYKQTDGKLYIDCDGPVGISVLSLSNS